MYEIGELMGLDRDAASRAAQDLMGLQLVEIRTLSGGIGISRDGAKKAQFLVGGSNSESNKAINLEDGRVLDQSDCQTVNRFTGGIKEQVGTLGLESNRLTDLTADLKTIDAQLGSSRPKAAIIRECFQSIRETLERVGENEILARLNGLLGE